MMYIITTTLTIIYIGGIVYTLGAIGGIRDEMDGIGDIFHVLFWPIVLLINIICLPFAWIHHVGTKNGKEKENNTTKT